MCGTTRCSTPSNASEDGISGIECPLDNRLQAAVAQDAAGLVDLRDPSSYAAGHIKGSSSFPLEELQLRSGELPPPTGSTLRVMADSEAQLAEGMNFLAGSGGSRKGWTVIDSFVWTPSLAAAAARIGCIAHGASSRPLWLPSPHLPRLASLLETRAGDLDALCAVDFGCGKGRDAIWLALRGWRVIGVDKQECFLSHLRDFARRQGVAERVRAHRLDFRREVSSEAFETLLRPPLALVNVSRFMHRPALDAAVRLMPADCCLAVHHFMRGEVSLKSGRQIKAGNAAECGLQPGELQLRFNSSLSEVLLDEVVTSCDGREMNNFAAIKGDAPASSQGILDALKPSLTITVDSS